MAARKKRPWNADLRIPGLDGRPEHVPPPPIPRQPVYGLTAPARPEKWRVRRYAADGSSELYTHAGEPWTGSATEAAKRAEVLGREDPDGRYEAERVPGG